MPKIKIAISGKAGSGKDTIASDRRYAFADPIKEIVMTMFPGAARQDLWGPSDLRSKLIPGETVTYRQALMDVGKLGRKYDPYIWVRHFENDLKRYNSVNLYILSDLRFEEELASVNKHDFVLIRVKRQNTIQIDDSSEKDQDQIPDTAFDYVINNDGTKDDLNIVCDKIISEL
jgi:hypothetical protein